MHTPKLSPSSTMARDSTTVEMVVMGGGGVGKSSLTIQYVQNFFVTGYDPTIEDTYRKQVEVDGKFSLLQVLDTAGQEEFFVMRDGWIRGGDCFLLVFSAASRRSFEELDMIHTQMYRIKDTDNKLPVVMVMNKTDLPDDEWKVSEEEAELKAKQFGCPLVKASAKTPLNVRESFEELVREHRRCSAADEAAVASKAAALAARRKAWMSMCSIM